MPEREEPWDVVVGRIVQAHGVEGWLKVLPVADSATRFASVGAFMLVLSTGESAPGAIQEMRALDRCALVKFAGVDGRDAAEALVGATINIRASMRELLSEGQYYVDEVIGLRVETTDGADLGTVREVVQTGANDVYVTPIAMIPAIPEAIQEIDIRRGVMRVRRAAVLLQG